MTMKSSILIPLLVIFVGTQAEAQLPPLLPPVSVGTLFSISGIVSCSVNASVNGSNILTPPFRNASVELSCGGNVIATATTNESGVFVILDRRGAMLSTLLSTCKVNVLLHRSRLVTQPCLQPSRLLKRH
ncbi:hypothetical protein M8C21_011289 [Ambrosia artemisiifolia]|uniref:Phylloplanin-like n=1 Tax=Ambrosia artemisiifolia TaxID=4212 RepID=A0AAD5CKD3_AMBAR|nr:hypothetical protein M8C21_011289 [Ambrosia artemisiifolia]